MKAKVGKRYKHYKGGEHTVLALGRLESDPSQVYVVYRAEYKAPGYEKGCVWLRPVTTFEEQVVINGMLVDRFTELS
jgi:hypothetical protein